MTTGFGFCGNCGTPSTGPGEKFCGSCGATLPAAAAAAAVPVAAAAAMPPTPPYAPPIPPYAPPPYAPAPGQPAWGMPPGAAPVGPARSSVNPLLLVVGALIIVALVAGGAYALGNSSKGDSGSSGSISPSLVGSASPSAAASSHYPGSIVFSPSTIGCPSQAFTTTVRLPASVLETDQITYRIDGTDIITQSLADFGMTQQPDGSWMVSDTNTNGSSNCSMGPGKHTATLLDASGQVLAQGTFTFVMTGTAKPTTKTTAKPTAVSKGSLTFVPSTFSCSATPVQVTLTIRLPASLAGSTEITAVIDGSVGATETVDSSLTQQSDGSWLGSTTDSSTTYCGGYSHPGTHTFSLSDQSGNVIVQGSFTMNP